MPVGLRTNEMGYKSISYDFISNCDEIMSFLINEEVVNASKPITFEAIGDTIIGIIPAFHFHGI